MKKIFKGKTESIFMLVLTLILAGVAIFTAVRLYQLRNVSVAPNVPSSKPRAAGENSCFLSFTLNSGSPLPTPTPVPHCNDACTVVQGCPLISGLSCSNGQCRNPNCSDQTDCICLGPTATPTATPTCAPRPACLDAVPPCKPAQPAEGWCPTPSPTTTPTPTPVPGCSISCTTDSDCPTDLSCTSGYCRNTSCSDQTDCLCPTTAPTATPTLTPTTPPSGAPNSCGGTCGSDANCMSGYYFCYNGYCRDRSCPDRTDCTCPGATGRPSSSPTPTTTTKSSSSTSTSTTSTSSGVKNGPIPTNSSLPESGTDWPTVIGAGIGVFVIIGSLLLAL